MKFDLIIYALFKCWLKLLLGYLHQQIPLQKGIPQHLWQARVCFEKCLCSVLKFCIWIRLVLAQYYLQSSTATEWHCRMYQEGFLADLGSNPVCDQLQLFLSQQALKMKTIYQFWVVRKYNGNSSTAALLQESKGCLGTEGFENLQQDYFEDSI